MKTITVCGSLRFYKKMMYLKEDCMLVPIL